MVTHDFTYKFYLFRNRNPFIDINLIPFSKDSSSFSSLIGETAYRKKQNNFRWNYWQYQGITWWQDRLLRLWRRMGFCRLYKRRNWNNRFRWVHLHYSHSKTIWNATGMESLFQRKFWWEYGRIMRINFIWLSPPFRVGIFFAFRVGLCNRKKTIS